jgi:hypothetical protein
MMIEQVEAAKLRIHDYSARRRCWGHDYVFTPDSDPTTARITGWGDGLRKGDFLLLTHPETRIIVVYELEEVAYYGNPGDMWRGRARFIPAASELGQRVRHTAMQDTIEHVDREWLSIQLREGVAGA